MPAATRSGRLSRASSPAPRALKHYAILILVVHGRDSRASSPAPRALKREDIAAHWPSPRPSRASSPAPRALKPLRVEGGHLILASLASLIARTEGIETRRGSMTSDQVSPREPHRPHRGH